MTSLPALALLAGAVCAFSTPADAERSVHTDRATQAALAKLEAQDPLTAADHTALKRAAQKLEVDVLRVCADPGNMPLSNIKREGYQNKIIELVANAMGAGVNYFWRPYLARGMTRQTLEAYDCDLLLDLPRGFERVVTTMPIYKTTYVLAWRNDSGLDIESLDDPKLKDLRIGVYQTSGLRMALTQRGIQSNVRLHVLSHDGDLKPENQPWYQVQQVVDGALDVAGVWGPFAGWLKAQGAPITVVPVNLMDDDTPLEFDLSLALKKTDYILMYKLDLVLEENKTEIEKILRSYGVPLVQCSHCVVAGDLPAHGLYTKPLAAPAPLDPSKLAPDQRVTRERLEAWLAEGADVDQEFANAVLAADTERVEFLIGKGAQVNKLDRQGQAALHSAARNRKHELIAKLIDLEADVNLRDRDGMTPLLYAVMRDDPVGVKLLAGRGADLEALAQGEFTPLGLAITEDRFRAAMALIEAGASVDAPSGEARLTPLMLASGKEGHRLSLGAGKDRIEKLNPHDPGTLEIARALIEKGANVNAVSGSGVTALILAAAHNMAPIVGLLVQSGADVGFKMADGRNAADVAKENGNNNVVSVLRLLEQSGSN